MANTPVTAAEDVVGTITVRTIELFDGSSLPFTTQVVGDPRFPDGTIINSSAIKLGALAAHQAFVDRYQVLDEGRREGTHEALIDGWL